jgi:hypothetical protein
MNERALQDIVIKFGVSSFIPQAVLFVGSERVGAPSFPTTPNIPAEESGRISTIPAADGFSLFGGDGMVPERCEHCASEGVPEWRRNGKIIWRTWPDGRPGEWACHYCGRAA